MDRVDLFPTTLWMGHLGLDASMILENVIEWKGGTVLQDNISKEEGKGNDFSCDDLFKAIKNNMPVPEGMDLPETYIQYWVNYNRPGDVNRKHHHTDCVVLSSGVYYLKVPENSGRFIVHDPRGRTIESMADSKFYGMYSELGITPEEDMIFYFPSWLEHEVEKNESDEIRVSIAFNILSKEEVDRYKDMDNLCSNNAVATRMDGRTEVFIS